LTNPWQICPNPLAGKLARTRTGAIFYSESRFETAIDESIEGSEVTGNCWRIGQNEILLVLDHYYETSRFARAHQSYAAYYKVLHGDQIGYIYFAALNILTSKDSDHIGIRAALIHA
jgi:hypothetical protein